MELLTPGTGLLFWQVVVFLGLFFLLSKMAWKPILSSLKERETSIFRKSQRKRYCTHVKRAKAPTNVWGKRSKNVDKSRLCF